jgi:hydroxymethylpyrimidine/phosphomethylpyrimidine kinase
LPVALTIAGSDSSAGAGIQADLKTFSALGVYGLTAVTCVVAETPGKVFRLEPIRPQFVRDQIDIVLGSFPVAAAKTGLLCFGEIISAVARSIAHKDIPLVVDPVMVATSGDPLLSSGAIEAYQAELFPLATLITPNLDEAARLLGAQIPDLLSMKQAARALGEKYGVSVLLKGGHLTGKSAVDALFHGGKITEFSSSFVRGIATHGTGCTYSAAITAGLACGLSLEDSIKRAKQFVTESIRRHLRWRTPTGETIDALNHGTQRSTLNVQHPTSISESVRERGGSARSRVTRPPRSKGVVRSLDPGLRGARGAPREIDAAGRQ